MGFPTAMNIYRPTYLLIDYTAAQVRALMLKSTGRALVSKGFAVEKGTTLNAQINIRSAQLVILSFSGAWQLTSKSTRGINWYSRLAMHKIIPTYACG